MLLSHFVGVEATMTSYKPGLRHALESIEFKMMILKDAVALATAALEKQTGLVRQLTKTVNKSPNSRH